LAISLGSAGDVYFKMPFRAFFSLFPGAAAAFSRMTEGVFTDD